MLYTFADCTLDPQRRTLWRAGQLRHLRPKVFDVLLYLVMHRDRVIDKQELCEQVWPEQFISDTTVESTLRAVRQAVGDNGKAQRLIQTFYRHGYRFVAAVDERGEERAAAETQVVPGQPMAAFPASTDSEARPLDEPAAAPQPPAAGGNADAERRHLTVLCCDLMDASALTTSCDPETLHEVLRAYHAACAAVVARFDGYIARYREDGLLVYFGFPRAHEDDAQRAVRAGLGIIEAVQHIPGQAVSLQMRVGLHTGLVVVGALGVGAGQTPLALGEVPQVAASLLAQAAPQTVVLSEATWRLVAGWFVTEALAGQAIPGMSQPELGYRVLRESGAQSRLEMVGPERLTPLVGRMAELALLQERWAQARDGLGQVVLLSGEAGIGKSRLAETLRAQVASEGCPQIVLRCSPYHTHSALFPVLEHLRRVARIHPEDTSATKLDKLEQMLGGIA